MHIAFTDGYYIMAWVRFNHGELVFMTKALKITLTYVRIVIILDCIVEGYIEGGGWVYYGCPTIKSGCRRKK